jgi:hypothetical protein
MCLMGPEIDEVAPRRHGVHGEILQASPCFPCLRGESYPKNISKETFA